MASESANTDSTPRSEGSGARPAVVSIPAHLPFLDTLARSLLARADPARPMALADTLLLLPNRRSVRAMRRALVQASPGGATLLPQITALGDVDEDEASGLLADDWTLAHDLPATISPMERRLQLAELVRHWLKLREARDAPYGEALKLADSLARTLDQLTIAGVALDALESAVPPELSAHWQESLNFLDIVTTQWPRHLEQNDKIDAADRRDQLIRMQAARWQDNPPDRRIIAAGSTGSVPATAALLRVISRLPQGQVILPGLDTDLDQQAWEMVDERHPQFGMKQLLDSLDVRREEVTPWPQAGAPPARTLLMRSAMLPAGLTSRWAQDAPLSLDGLTLIEAASEAEEAAVIALAMRETLELPGDRTAALVTPDAHLPRRVQAELLRYGLKVDSSAGTPLHLTPPATFMELIAQAAAEGFAPIPLLGLLKHPMCAVGGDRERTRSMARRLDLMVLRGERPSAGLDGLRRIVQACGRTAHPADRPALEALASWLNDVLAPALSEFAAAMTDERCDLQGLLEAHARAAEALSGGDHENPAQVWQHETGAMLARVIGEVAAQPCRPQPIETIDYPAAFRALLDGQVVRPAFGSHPRLAIWGPIEARLLRADRIILAGLNEGTWPADAAPDPWLSPALRRTLSLPTLEQRIGQSAHDFVQAASAPEVILTRALRSGDAPAVASRFWLRLQAASGNQLHTDQRLVQIARGRDLPVAVVPADRPTPNPPLAMRPDRISVTDVDTLLSDPYAFYARKILRLRPLDPLDSDPTAAERGTSIHTAMEDWLGQPPALWTADALYDHLSAQLLNAATEPLYQALQRPRLRNIAAWAAAQVAAESGSWTVLLREPKGSTTIDGIALTGKADRIDRSASGKQLRIIDYKSGGPPTGKQLKALYALQLPLLGLIAQRGGFDALNSAGLSAVPVEAFAYWQLSGGLKEPGKATDPLSKWQGADEWISQAAAKLSELIAHFLKAENPFQFRPRPDYAKGDDFLLLGRYQEWQGQADD